MASVSRPDRRAGARRAGFTLLEMLVVITVLGVLSALVGLAWTREPPPSAGDPGPAARIAAAQREAIAKGTAVTLQVDVGGRTVRLRALPDGRLLGAEPLGLDPLGGRPLAVLPGTRPVAPAPAGAR
jgi:prepilin-type N-terminal cleavage/methylation domain-containing protein